MTRRPHLQDLWEGSEPRPQGKTPQERPRLEWQMKPRGSATLRRVVLTVNERPIPVRYDRESATVIGEPVEPLPLGTCRVHCEVWLSSDQEIELDWTFTRVPTPPPAPPPDPLQLELIAQLNRLRRTALLPEVQSDAALCLAALRHSRYLLVNRLAPTHEEQPGKVEFYAETPEERAERAGCFLPCYEVIAMSATPRTAVQALMDAPYHRTALLQPERFRVGAGAAGDRTTVLCSLSEHSGVIVYPGDGQLDVPPQWLDTELPDPLRLYPGASRTVGYPITLHFYGPEGKLELREAALRGPNNQPIACYTNTPSNDDELDDTLILIPQKPLLPETTYTVRIAVRTPAGTDVSRSWQFTTAKLPSLPAPPAKKAKSRGAQQGAPRP